MFSKHLWWLLPILTMALITPWTPEWDKQSAAYFYKNHFKSDGFYHFMYTYSILPALIVAILAFIVLAGSYVFSSWKQWRKPSWLLVLSMVVGAGFIVHTVLKDHWGRPRPRQVVEFGGAQNFRPYYSPYFDNPIPSKSFPCGHCTMGFYFFAAALVLRRMDHRIWSNLTYCFALLLGIALGITRMSQGGHFVSDVLMTALIMWLVARGFDALIYNKETA